MSHNFKNYYEIQRNATLQQNVKYKKKYRKLKRIIKDMVFENAALCDQVAQMQDNLVQVKDERLFLLRKLCQQQGQESEPLNSSSLNKYQINSSNYSLCSHDGSTLKKNSKKRNSTDALDNKSKSKRASSKATRKLVQLIPLDVHGRPIFPISLGDLTVFSLGEVVTDRVGYHTEDLIYPVGYCSTRVYASLKDPKTKSLYTCKILDDGVRPRFEIASDSDLNQPLIGSSPDECHAQLLSTISPVLRSIIPKGADFFGISHPTIQNLIQSSPGTRKLSLYKTQKFEVMKLQDKANIPMEEETDPGLAFNVLHKLLFQTGSYKPETRVKEETLDHDKFLQGLLA